VIEKNKVVSISYCLKNTKGEELDQAGADKPLEYLHGCGNIVPGLENALDGLKIGNKKEVTVEPEDGYGEILTDLKMEVELTRKLPQECSLWPNSRMGRNIRST